MRLYSLPTALDGRVYDEMEMEMEIEVEVERVSYTDYKDHVVSTKVY